MSVFISPGAIICPYAEFKEIQSFVIFFFCQGLMVYSGLVHAWQSTLPSRTQQLCVLTPCLGFSFGKVCAKDLYKLFFLIEYDILSS